MSKHRPTQNASPRFSLSEADSDEDFEDFFGESEEGYEYADDWDDDEFHEYDDDDEDEDFGEDYGEDAEWVEIPEALADSEDWVAIYESGHDFYSAIEMAYPELAGADHTEIEMAVAEMLEGMSEAEIAELFGRIGRIGRAVSRAGKKAIRFTRRRVVPKVRRALPTVARVARPAGALIGTAFGNPMLGARIGGAVGAGARQLSNVLGPPRRVRRRATQPRRIRRGMRVGNFGRRRSRRSRAYRIGRGAGHALSRVMRNRNVQRALSQGARGAVSGLFGEEYGMSDAAVLEAIIGGAELALAEMEDARDGILAVEGGYGPEDFDSSEAAFESLLALVESDDV